MYYISKATLKIANKQYTTLKNDYEMTLHAHSSIVPCEDTHDIPSMQCDFVPIGDLENRDKDAIIGKWKPKWILPKHEPVKSTNLFNLLFKS